MQLAIIEAASAAEDLLRMTQTEMDLLVSERINATTCTPTDIVLFGLWLDAEEDFPLRPGDKNRTLHYIKVRDKCRSWCARAISKHYRGVQQLVRKSNVVSEMVEVILDAEARQITADFQLKQA